MRYAVVDVETSDLSVEAGRVLSVAVVHADGDGTVERTWVSLLNPGCDPGAVEIHGLTRGRLAGSPTFADIADELHELLADRVFVAHNAAFDWAFVSAEAGWLGRRLPNTHRLCTVALSRRLDLPNYKLPTVAAHWGVPPWPHHDALGDAIAAAAILGHSLRAAAATSMPLPLVENGRAMVPGAWVRPPLYRGEWVNPGRLAERLTRGMRVVLTGPTAVARATLYEQWHAAGLEIAAHVNRKTSVLVCNHPASDTGKARAARSLGIPVVSEEEFAALLTEIAPGRPFVIPRQRSRPAVPSGGPSLAGRRFLVLGGPHDEAAAVRGRIAALGGSVAVNLTRSVTDLVCLEAADADSRFARAENLPCTPPAALFSASVAAGVAVAPGSLPRGGVVDLPNDPVWTVGVSWSWEAAEDEVDVVAFLLDESERVRADADFVFYNQPSGAGVALGIDGPAEASVRIDLSSLPPWCVRVRVAAALSGAATFGDVGPIEIQGVADGRVHVRSVLDAATSERSLMLADLYRRGDGWRLRAVGQGFDHGLAGLATAHGVTVD